MKRYLPQDEQSISERSITGCHGLHANGFGHAFLAVATFKVYSGHNQLYRGKIYAILYWNIIDWSPKYLGIRSRMSPVSRKQPIQASLFLKSAWPKFHTAAMGWVQSKRYVLLCDCFFMMGSLLRLVKRILVIDTMGKPAFFRHLHRLYIRENSLDGKAFNTSDLWGLCTTAIHCFSI